MAKRSLGLALLCVSLSISVPGFPQAVTTDTPSSTQPVNPVIEWNRTLLKIVRTPGAQPATIHSTRNFAILHIAIFDAVNDIDRDFRPYAVRPSHVSRRASISAAAVQTAHDVLVALYPSSTATLDSQLRQDLDHIPYGQDKDDGIEVGKAVAAATLASRSKDGSERALPPFVPSPGRDNIN